MTTVPTIKNGKITKACFGIQHDQVNEACMRVEISLKDGGNTFMFLALNQIQYYLDQMHVQKGIFVDANIEDMLRNKKVKVTVNNNTVLEIVKIDGIEMCKPDFDNEDITDTWHEVLITHLEVFVQHQNYKNYKINMTLEDEDDNVYEVSASLTAKELNTAVKVLGGMNFSITKPNEFKKGYYAKAIVLDQEKVHINLDDCLVPLITVPASAFVAKA